MQSLKTQGRIGRHAVERLIDKGKRIKKDFHTGIHRQTEQRKNLNTLRSVLIGDFQTIHPPCYSILSGLVRVGAGVDLTLARL